MTTERDLQAEQDHAEWRGWMEAQGYDFDDDSYQAEAFAAGMSAARDLGDWFEVGDANAGTGRPAPELQAGEIVYLYHWRFDRGEEFGLYRHAADADAAAAQHADEGLSEVLSMAVLGRPEQPAPELAAAMAETRKVADAANVVLDAFTRGSDGYRARLSGVTLMRAYKAIGRPIPDHLRHLQGQ